MTTRKTKNDWTSVDPADMTDAQLGSAAQALTSRLNELNSQIAPLSQALQRVQAVVGAKYYMQLPGVPQLTSTAPWPGEYLDGYDFPAVTTAPDDAPSS